MPDERRDGCFLDCTDWSAIEMRVLAMMTDNGPARKRAADRRERIVNAMMTPTGRRPSEPEMQRV